MKLVSLLLAASTAAAGIIEERQGGCKVPPPAGPPQFRKNAQRKYFLLNTAPKSFAANPNAAPGDHSHGGGGAKASKGKGKIGGGMMGDGQPWHVRVTGSGFCGTCTVLSGQIKIFYPDGTPATLENGIYVHHILTRGPAIPEFISFGMSGQAGAPGSGFVGAGEDNGNRPWVYTPKEGAGSFDSGFQLSPSTSFTTEVVLVNYNKQPKSVCVAYDLEYLPGHVGKKIKSSLISSAGIRGPKTSNSGALNTTGSAMPFLESGWIVASKGHLHDGGSNMYMKITGKKNYSCVSRATYGSVMGGASGKSITDMSDCNKEPWRVEAGDRMTLTAEYDLKAHPLRETTTGGKASTMGMVRVLFAPDKKW